jgi:hypothetical protein
MPPAFNDPWTALQQGATILEMRGLIKVTFSIVVIIDGDGGNHTLWRWGL